MLHHKIPPSNERCGEPRCGHPAGRGHPRVGWVRFYEALPDGQDGEAIWFCSRQCLVIWLVDVEKAWPSPVQEDCAMSPEQGLALLNQWSGLGLSRRDVTAQRVNRAAAIASERLAAEHEECFQAVYVPLIERAYEAALDYVLDAVFGSKSVFNDGSARTRFDDERDVDLGIAHMLKNPHLTFHGACLELGINSALITELTKIYESLKETA